MGILTILIIHIILVSIMLELGMNLDQISILTYLVIVIELKLILTILIDILLDILHIVIERVN